MKRFGLLFLMLATLITSLASCAASKEDGRNLATDAPAVQGGFAESGKDVATVPAERKIVKTYALQTETTAFDASRASLTDLVEKYGGYVESSQVSNKSLSNSSTGYRRSASYTLRIPAEQAEAFVGEVGNALHVTSNSSTVEDVSESYYTVEATLEELTAERDSLLAMMGSLDEKADYNFWLTLQQRLSEVKQQIAVLQAQLQSYDSRVAYSTVRLQIEEVVNLTEQAENNSFGSRMGAAFRESWVEFGEGCQAFAIFFVGSIPTFLVLGGLIAVVAVVLRRRKRKKALLLEEKETE